MTNCPLCGFRQRIDRLTGLAFQVKDMENDLLPLESIRIYADKGREGFRSVREPVSLPAVLEQEMLRALAVKLFPLVQYLQVRVPEFREVTTEVLELVVELDQGVHRDVEVGVRYESEVDASWQNVKSEWGVPLTEKASWLSTISGLRKESESSKLPPLPARASLSKMERPMALDILVPMERPVPMDSPVTKVNQ